MLELSLLYTMAPVFNRLVWCRYEYAQYTCYPWPVMWAIASYL